MSKRIQRKRIKGWRMPENAVSVTRPGLFGNPFGGDREEAVRAYRSWLAGEPTGHLYAGLNPQHREEVLRNIVKLVGKDLACWCDNGPCHADVLLEYAANMSKQTRYMCKMCGRSKFTRIRQPHRCNSQFRKRWPRGTWGEVIVRNAQTGKP